MRKCQVGIGWTFLLFISLVQAVLLSSKLSLETVGEPLDMEQLFDAVNVMVWTYWVGIGMGVRTDLEQWVFFVIVYFNSMWSSLHSILFLKFIYLFIYFFTPIEIIFLDWSFYGSLIKSLLCKKNYSLWWLWLTCVWPTGNVFGMMRHIGNFCSNGWESHLNNVSQIIGPIIIG